MIASQTPSDTQKRRQGAPIVPCATVGCGWPARYGTASGYSFCALPGCQRRLLVVRIAEWGLRTRILASNQPDDRATLRTWIDFARRAENDEVEELLSVMGDLVALVSEPVWPWCGRGQTKER